MNKSDIDASGSPSRVTFADVTTRYVYVLFGLVAHLYLIFSSSLYFVLEEEFEEHLGVTRETIVVYFAFFSIILLLISLQLKWTWPFKKEEALIVIFLWILLRNLMPKDCLCCEKQTVSLVVSSSSPALQNACSGGWSHIELLYSVLCLIVMISSFMMHAKHYGTSIFFSILGTSLMILTSLIPVSCNQFNHTTLNSNMLKFTLHSIVWFVNRRMRLTEQVLANHYLKSLRILFSYASCQNESRHLFLTTTTTTTGRARTQVRRGEYYDAECSIPTILFQKLERLSHNIMQQKRGCRSGGGGGQTKGGKMSREEVRKKTTFKMQLHNLTRIYRIHQAYKARRWFSGFFSWKHRFYDTEILNIFDLAKTLWILNVCPIFLIFSFIEYLLILYQTKVNIDELRRLIEVIALMDCLYKQHSLGNYYHYDDDENFTKHSSSSSSTLTSGNRRFYQQRNNITAEDEDFRYYNANDDDDDEHYHYDY